MSDDFITVKGLDEIKRSLYSYSQQLGDKVMISALRQGANVIARAARAAAPRKTGPYRGKAAATKRPGSLARGIIVLASKKYKPRPGANEIGVYMAIRKAKRGSAKSAPFYGRFQEVGWNVRGKSLGKNGGPKSAVGENGSRRRTTTGKRDVPPKKFIANSFQRLKVEAANTIIRAAAVGAELVKSKLGLK